MPDEDRVFDVTKPGRVNPSATSKPVIVGHQPTMNDPMVREGSPPTRIEVNDTSEPAPTDIERDRFSYAPAPAPEPPTGSLAEPTATPAIYHPAGDQAPPSDDIQPIENSRFEPSRRKRRWPKVVLALLVLLIAAYLLIDAGVIGSNINLPVHIFKQKKQNTSTSNSPPASSNTATAPVVPDGFKEYKLAGTALTFAAPIAWGDPTSSAEPGYSQRGGTNQSDGTYAYLVNFATEKDIQIAVTSDKFLPVARATLYYDYLQWCKGTSDNKTYESILHFTTANKIDTPTTITCDQGPVPSAVEIDSTTILQPKATDTTGKTIGDIYTKNLTDPSLVVFRVKDAAMTNGDDIKTLLTTVKLGASSSSSPSNSSQ
ncbi:MAG: hypothetical protein ACREGG_02930 [Candidatus Saccharimonadales bacterium]